MPPVKKNKDKKPNADNVETEGKKTVISGQLLKKLEKKEQKRNVKKERGVVLIKHLPHGFFEEQLKKYFEQFGKVTRLRLVRSRKTGGSKGFAFVEFEYPDVAQVAADTMDNYLMFQKLVKAAYIPPDKQLYNYFKTTVRKVKNKAGKTIFVSNKTAAIKRKVEEHNNWTEDKRKKLNDENLKKIKKLNEKYAHLGLDFSTICLGGKESKINVDTHDPKLESKSAKKSKAEQSLVLEDLLGNTIQDDSNDEDWNGSEISEEEFADSLYVDNEDDSDVSSNNDENDDDIKPVVKMAKKSIKTVTKEDLYNKQAKRKPHSGGVQKMNKKPIKKPTPLLSKQAKNPLVMKMVKETAKPMAKINNKPKSLKKNVGNKKK